MSAEEEVPQSHLDAKLITDLRATWAAWAHHDGSVTITAEEMDALLRAVDQRDRLLDEMCSMPDEAQAAPVQAVDIPAGHAVIGGKIVPLPTAPRGITARCTCGDPIYLERGTWYHATRHGNHPAEPAA